MSQSEKSGTIEHTPNQGKKKLNDILRAVFDGAGVGFSATVVSSVSGQPETLIGIGGYLASRRILSKFLSEKPAWLEATVESGIAIPLIVIFNEVLLDVWKLSISSVDKIYDLLNIPSEVTQPILENMKDFPELAIYLVFFLLLAQGSWRRLAKEKLGK